MAAAAPAGAPVSRSAAASSWYRAVWRWHFYAGLLVLPFLVWLAVTGGLFVFKAEIDGYFHHGLKYVEPTTEQPAPASELVAAALAAHPGTLRKYTQAASAHEAAEVGIAAPGGEQLSVFVNPYSRQVLGTLPEGGSVAWTIRKLHSLKYFGPIARGAIEIAAGWSILLVLTGLYLWWPRSAKHSALAVRGKPAQRVFWRDLHAVTGVFVGVAVVFLAITGMPWSVLWGAKVNQWANGHNFGYVAGVRVQVPMSEIRLKEGAATPWSLEHARVPLSSAPGHEEHAGHDSHPPADDPRPIPGPDAMHPALDLDAAVGRFQQLGMAAGYTVNPPRGATGVYTASAYPHDLSLQRVVHIDQYSGKVLLDMRYSDYGPLARWLEWGINVHLGQEFGVPNQAVLLIACAGIVLLCTSAGVMWWKRRPTGGLGVPPLPSDRRTLGGIAALLAIGGALFPLVGASLLVMLTLDFFFRDNFK